MKILFWLCASLDRQSPSSHLLTDMIEALCRRGHCVVVLQKSTDGPRPLLPIRLEQLGVQTVCFRTVCPPKRKLLFRLVVDLIYLFRCGRWMKSQRAYDRVFLQSSTLSGIQIWLSQNRWADVPVILNVQDIFPENAVCCGMIRRDGICYKLFAGMQQYAYVHAAAIITISEDMKEQLIMIGASESKITIIYNWGYGNAAAQNTDKDEEFVRTILKPGKTHIVYAGNVGVMQNVGLLLEAALRMKADRDLCFHVIGDGSDLENLKQRAADLHIENLCFHSRVEEKYAALIYRTAHANIIPLRQGVYRTALPSKIAMCLACGRPMVLAIGCESRFGRRFHEATGAAITDSNDAEALCKVITEIKTGKITALCSDRSYVELFSGTTNSMKYAQIIEQ